MLCWLGVVVRIQRIFQVREEKGLSRIRVCFGRGEQSKQIRGGAWRFLVWEEGELASWAKSCSRGSLPGKVSVNFTFPHFHIILRHFSTDSRVLFYWSVWTSRIIGMFLLNHTCSVWFHLGFLTPLVSSWCMASSLSLIYNNHAFRFLLISPIMSPWMSPEMRLCTFMFCMFTYLLFPQFFILIPIFAFIPLFRVFNISFGLAILIGVLLREPHVSHFTYSLKFLDACKPYGPHWNA